jgi:hypothetical protein
MVVTPPKSPSAAAPADHQPVAAVAALPTAAPARAAMETAHRIVEPIVIAVVSSTGVYLVGSVYTEAYYGRMSIDAAALDLSPLTIALQAVHVVQSLLLYPGLVLVLYVLHRVVVARLPRARAWLGRQHQGIGRLVLLVVNGLIILPLILAAAAAGANRTLIQTNSVLSEVASLMQFTGFVLVVYVLWLSLGPRRLLLADLQRRRVVPIVLVFLLYLLGALVNTADRARANAERLMTGVSDASVAITFAMAPGRALPTSADLLLVTIRNDHYFVVERQPDPPSRTPVALAIPIGVVDAVTMERVIPAAPAAEGIVIVLFPESPSPTP